MREVIEKLEKMIQESESKIAIAKEGIESLQAICEHFNPDGTDAYTFIGNDSHYKYYECKNCKKTIKL